MISCDSSPVSVQPAGIDVVGVVGRVVVVVVDDAVVEVLDEVVDDDAVVGWVDVVALPDPEVPHPAITVTAATTIGTDIRYLRRTVTRAPWEGRSCHPRDASRRQVGVVSSFPSSGEPSEPQHTWTSERSLHRHRRCSVSAASGEGGDHEQQRRQAE